MKRSRNPLQKGVLYKERRNVEHSLSVIKTVIYTFFIFLPVLAILPLYMSLLECLTMANNHLGTAIQVRNRTKTPLKQA